MKRKDIEAGVAGFAEKLGSTINLSDCKSAEILLQERANDDDLGVATVTSNNAADAQNHELPQRQTTGPGEQENPSAEGNQPPAVELLNGEVTIESGQTGMAFAGGLHCEVWKGVWKKAGGKRADGERDGIEKVALRTLRMTKSVEKARNKLERELPTWAELRHGNVLPFYGIVTDIGTRLYMVSPWREKGNLLAYVTTNPQSDKNYLLRGSAGGLSYLHSKGVVHGSVKCNNVLISQEGEPQICDFGFASLIDESNEGTKTASEAAVVRYAAPEQIEDSSHATTYSDAYSFAMLIIECVTEAVPFSNINRDAAVIHARIGKRQRPLRPDGPEARKRVSDSLWDLMGRCWSEKPDQRPTMEQVHRFFLDHIQHNDDI